MTSDWAPPGLEVENVDCTIILETPKARAPTGRRSGRVSPKPSACPPQRVNIKATTGEAIGFVGRGEGVAALAIA